MNNVLEYKGYYTKVLYSAEDQVLYGKIEGIKDLVNFECENLGEVEQEFHNAVDDYLALCHDLGEEPDKPYKGVFNVRISPELHRKASIMADQKGETLNAFVADAIQAAVG
ncbi:MAG: type II toxin-antitoxin system HicB family antitoxin [Oscillospiraceae bacterium]|nr:type II toxin-antitoxin system HicB family antitoxin [Oscillospiraceae bacterium]